MHIPKRYGQSKSDSCPFCGAQAITMHGEVAIPVCLKHKAAPLPPLKCMCGDWLDLRSSKWGPYFNCMRCGNVSWSKGMDVNEGAFQKALAGKKEEMKVPEKVQRRVGDVAPQKEKVVRSDDPDYFA